MKKSRILFALGLVIPVLASCGKGDDGKIHVKFDMNTSGINIKVEQLPEITLDEPTYIDEPIVTITENPDNYNVYGWYTDKTFNTAWDFLGDTVEKSMTLHASWKKQYAVTYYQAVEGETPQQIWQTVAFENEYLDKHEELQDCYEDLGYYRNCTEEGVFSDPIDFSQGLKITGDTKIYLKKSPYVYITPDAIQRRFVMKPAGGGIDGSTTGYTTKKTEVIDGQEREVSEVHFGWAKKTADPFMLLFGFGTGLDVTKSQTLEITMRNLGPGDGLNFYWVGKWADGTWIDGKEYQSFVEEHAYHFKGATVDKQGKTFEVAQPNPSYDPKDPTSQKYTPTEWVTYRLPLCQKLNNGVSTWGAAFRITALRIQCGYVGKDESEADDNVIQIASIKGCQDEEDKQYTKDDADTEDIKSLLKDDEPEAVEEVRQSQGQNRGFVFPKNDGEMTITDGKEETQAEVYKKTTGTEVYGKRTNGAISATFTPSADNREIKLEENNNIYSTLSIKYYNYSYMSTFATVKVYCKHEDGTVKALTKNDVPITTRMGVNATTPAEVKINLFQMGFGGTLEKIIIAFTPVGVDNLIKFDSFTFNEYTPKQIVGENFCDLNINNSWPGTGGASITFDKSTLMGKVATLDGGYITKDIPNYDLLAYKSLSFTYLNASPEITKVTITLIFTDNKTKDIVIPITSSNTEITTTADLEILDRYTPTTTDAATVDKIKISFTGSGIIYLDTMEYNLYPTSINLSNRDYEKSNGGTFDSKRVENVAYDENNLAYGRVAAGSNAAFKLYGFDQRKSDGQLINNFSLEGKKYFVLVYHNGTSKNSDLGFSYGATSEKDTSTEIEKSTNINTTKIKGTGELLTPQGEDRTGLQDSYDSPASVNGGESMKMIANMAEGTWATVVVPFNASVVSEDLKCFITFWHVHFNTAQPGSFLVRSMSVI